MKIKINDEFDFILDKRLLHTQLINVVLDCHKILEWEENWGDENEAPIHPLSWWYGVTFLTQIANLLIEKDLQFRIIPTIDPCSDGTIDIDFDDGTNGSLLINIDPDGNAKYYGDSELDHYSMKGKLVSINYINIKDISEKEFIKFIENYLTIGAVA